MNKLQKILSLCVEKGLSFYVEPKHDSVSVYKIQGDEYVFNYNSYYNEANEMYGFELSDTIHIDKLIEKIEEYER